MLWRSGLALILCATAALSDPLTFVWRTALDADLPRFGGFSAIEMQTQDAAIVLSDRGSAFAFSIDRRARHVAARPVGIAWADRDTEGLAWANGQLFFSFEGPAEVGRSNGRVLPRAPSYREFPQNGGFEALAGTPDGILYAIPERPASNSARIPVLQLNSGRWSVLTHLPSLDGFSPVGADLGPDGYLYLLLRSFSPVGFRSQVARLDPSDPTGSFTPLLTTALGAYGNLEGLAVWQSQSGATCLTMVSDNNFLSLQRSELVEYALTETLAGGATCD
ncbi:esterase-like activity of phytase family protein [uncultured Tateyamaria sp.]|uniref:esterase-like activity of phytase family protein n=1 Tax=uncultured Tateyamaria sp. TaxID=455651 RepID=UPI002619642E|nr:esterase-like activity of phytase family protein [uncultured Tateyamaria sp.]